MATLRSFEFCESPGDRYLVNADQMLMKTFLEEIWTSFTETTRIAVNSFIIFFCLKSALFCIFVHV